LSTKKSFDQLEDGLKKNILGCPGESGSGVLAIDPLGKVGCAKNAIKSHQVCWQGEHPISIKKKGFFCLF